MKIIITIIILIGLGTAFYFLQDTPQWRLLSLLISTPLEEVKQQYTNESCNDFNDKEKEQGYFEALITGYCKPTAIDFIERQDFLCAVGLNCSCPDGRSPEPNCFGQGSTKWSSCLEFDDQTVDYCHQTASQTKPQAGHIAADWECFNPLSTVNIDGKNYIVTDKGSAITGRRFDIWFDNCQDAFKVLGVYQVTIPHYE